MKRFASWVLVLLSHLESGGTFFNNATPNHGCVIYHIENLCESLKLRTAFTLCYDWLGFVTEFLVNSIGILVSIM